MHRAFLITFRQITFTLHVAQWICFGAWNYFVADPAMCGAAGQPTFIPGIGITHIVANRLAQDVTFAANM
jgi:hypothetical protein